MHIPDTCDNYDSVKFPILNFCQQLVNINFMQGNFWWFLLLAICTRYFWWFVYQYWKIIWGQKGDLQWPGNNKVDIFYFQPCELSLSSVWQKHWEDFFLISSVSLWRKTQMSSINNLVTKSAFVGILKFVIQEQISLF